MTVDLSPVLSTAIQLGALGLMVVGGWAIQRLAVKLGVDAHAAVANQLDQVVNKAIATGAAAANDTIKAKGWDHPDVKNQVLAVAAVALRSEAPGLLKKAGIDLGDPVTAAARIQTLLNRAFPTAMAPVAASPVTPPTPVAAPPTTS